MRGLGSVKGQTGNWLESHVSRLAHHVNPWVLWLFGIPVATMAFWILHQLVGQDGWMVTIGLGVGTLIVTRLTWKVSASRGIGRWHHAANAFAILGWMTISVTKGWHRPEVIAYMVGGFVSVLIWNVRYSRHADGAVDVVEPASGAPSAKVVDFNYLIRVAAGRYPAIRQAAEAGGKAVPVLVTPWREQPRALATREDEPLAITSGDGGDDAPTAVEMRDAAEMARRIQHNWRDLTNHKQPDLNGARMVFQSVFPWRITAEVHLVRGVQLPDLVEGARGYMASQCGLPLSSVLVNANPRNHGRAFMTFALVDVLATPRMWPGPWAGAIGKSVAAAPLRFGIYEDRRIASRFAPAITPAMAARLGLPEKNLSHLLSEGMNGSGKSSLNRLFVTERSTRIDVVEWLVDTGKKTQTFGQLGQAFDWFAMETHEAKNLVRFLADKVIPARGRYLGDKGLDNWEEGCGLPYLVVTIEEGGVIAQELDDLDKVMMLARSTGVELNFSVQRAHHALVDTNVRAQFSDTASFGANKIDDVFAMPDELVHAGADPSIWKNKKPGMLYWASSDLELPDWLMPVRTFREEPREMRGIIAEYEPTRRAWIAEHCPDWFEMLRQLDVKGVYANRPTGDAVLRQIEEQERIRGVEPPKRRAAKPVLVGAGGEDADAAAFPINGARLDEADEVLLGEVVEEGDEPTAEQAADEKMQLLEAATIVVNTQSAVEVMLQTRMGVTPAVAAALMEDLERVQIVGPKNAAGDRRVTLAAHNLTEIVQRLIRLNDGGVEAERDDGQGGGRDGYDDDEYDDMDDDEEDDVSLEDLGLPDDLLARVQADAAGFDGKHALPPLPGAGFSWEPPADGVELSRAEAIRTVRLYLRAKPAGWQFRPRDLYEELCAATRRTPSWLRGELTTFLGEGLIVQRGVEGHYEVTERVLLVTTDGDLPGATYQDAE